MKPSQISLKPLNFKPNDKVSNPPKTKISLAEKFANYQGPNLAKDFTWDAPQGKEIL